MAPGQFRDYVESVRSSMDIVQVVGESVSLRKAGRSFVGLCPFHQEKTPSFHVDQGKGLYFCFGCGTGGDAFKFVMNFHQVEFSDAVRMIGDRLGIPRPAPATAREAQEDRERRRALEALAEAQAFFEERLGSQAGSGAREYLERRGLDLEAARRFGIGYAPPGWDNLLRHLVTRNFRQEEILRAGLVVPRPSGDGVYDRFRSRITFPIRDTAGRIVSFGGRALGNEDPKYLNGPETPVYDKGRTLFRLHETAQEVRQARRVVVVEGYFDAVSLAAAGVPGVVAVCGTAFGAPHAQLVRRFADQVVLLFDGDSAGRRAAHRAVGPVLAAGLGLRVACPPDGQDPDDLAKTGGISAVEACLGAARDLPHFLVDEARKDFDLESLEGRVKALEMILGHLAQLESPLARADAAGRIAEGLGLDDQVVRDELRRAARERRRELGGSAGAVAPSAAKARKLTPAEADLIRFLVNLEHPGTERDRIASEIPLEALGPLARKVITRWADAAREGSTVGLTELAEVVEAHEATHILALPFVQAPEPDLAAALGAVDALRSEHLKAREAALQDSILHARDAAEQDRLALEKLAAARQRQALRHGPAGIAQGGSANAGSSK